MTERHALTIRQNVAMVVSERKQREIAEREAQILDVAEQMLLERGYLGLTMDRIAAEMEYSKGTIYNHFPSKEEVLMAVAARIAALRTEMFRRASTFQGSSRERMTAIGLTCELFMRLYPHYFRLEQVLAAESIRDKTSPQRQQEMDGQELGCMHVVVGIVRDGVAAGEIELPAGTTAETLCFGLWTITFGGQSVIGSGKDLSQLGIDQPWSALRRNQQALMDAHGWTPHTDSWDYEASRLRAMKEVFSDECRAAGLL